MLTRLYVDNYKCLVNFEFSPGPLALLLGPNGSGKSTVFEALALVRRFIAGEATTNDLFRPAFLTRWEQRNTQTFEIGLAGDDGDYQYHLEIEHYDPERRLCRIKTENLLHGGKPLFKSEREKAWLYHDDHKPGPEILRDWFRSSLCAIQPRSDNKKLTWFKKRVAGIWAIRIDPHAMSATTEEEKSSPDQTMANFSSWLRHVTQQSPDRLLALMQTLRENVFPGFETFTIAEHADQVRVLKARFSVAQEEGQRSAPPVEFRLDELSEGQRVLVVLYSLAAFAFEDDVTLCLDEPDNYVALPEIQPWLMSLVDKVEEQGRFQALLISHHPEMINILAHDHGQWMERPGGAHSRVHAIKSGDKTGLPLSELIARGWLHA